MIIDKITLASTILDGGEGEQSAPAAPEGEGSTASATLLDDGEEKSGDDSSESSEQKDAE